MKKVRNIKKEGGHVGKLHFTGNNFSNTTFTDNLSHHISDF